MNLPKKRQLVPVKNYRAKISTKGLEYKEEKFYSLVKKGNE